MYVGNLESLLFLIYSSRMREQFIGEEPSVRDFSFSVMIGCIISLIIDSKILDMVGMIVIPR